jgi:hypothetical protein
VRDAEAILDGLTVAAGLPGVPEVIEAARGACTRLRWHPALRRRQPEAHAEVLTRAAQASAALDGAVVPLAVVRSFFSSADLDAGQGRLDPAQTVALGALRTLAEVDRLGATLVVSPRQTLARWHAVAAGGLLDADHLGRPRPDESGELTARLDQLAKLLAAPEPASALVVAALAQAEILALQPFEAANGVLARAVSRAVIGQRGLDPMAVALWEVPLMSAGPGYRTALEGYLTGTAEGVAGWIILIGRAVVDGADRGREVCDAVLAGRL